MRPSGYASHPGYRIEIRPLPGRTEARAGGRLLASSIHALRLDEQEHVPVIYFPRTDVDMAALIAIPGRLTHCPFKGDADYWSLPGRLQVPVAWSYADPYVQVMAIRDHIAFYTGQVMVTAGG